MSRRSRRSAPPLRVLTVCTGNICRSPLAEELLRQWLADHHRFEIASAGLRAVVGAPMDAEAARQLHALGGSPAGLFGEQIDGARVDAADLILTMTVSQRDHLVRSHPRASQRTYTLAEFAHLLEAVAPDPSRTEDPRDLIASAARARSSVRLTPADDVPDPIDATSEVHAAVAAQIAGLVKDIAFALR